MAYAAFAGRMPFLSLNQQCQAQQMSQQQLTTSPPKVIWEKHVATHYGRECTHSLRVLAVQCPLQTSPVTQPWVCYIHTTSVPLTHRSLTITAPNHNFYLNPNPTYHTNPTTITS